MADRTPLYDRHAAAGARMFEFGGWEMPLWYSSIVEEHLAVRSSVGLFDVSHMGKLLVRGAGAELEKLFTRSFARQPSGKCIYALMLDDGGRIIDDMIALKASQDCHFVVCNASTRAKVLRWMTERASSLVIDDLTKEYSCIAVQGPKASALIGKVSDPATTTLHRYHGAFAMLRFPHGRRSDRTPFDWSRPISQAADGDSNGMPSIVTRTGYTGEDGFELFTSAGDAGFVWDELLKAGENLSARPVGLGARDTLRLEMCYLLSGHDFDGSQSPLQADAGFAVDWDHDFIGKKALDVQKGEDYPRLAAFESVGKGIPREGYRLLSSAGEEIGRATSGTMSPSLNIGIGMGYLPASHAAPGTKIFYEVGTRRVEAKTIEKPFLKKR
jgi:aminomethyltransferase